MEFLTTEALRNTRYLQQPPWATAKIGRGRPVSRITFPGGGPGTVWLPRRIHLGQVRPVRPPAETVDILTAVRTLYGAYVGVEPLVTFLGSHPVVTLSMLMLAILAGGAVGGYIGAGLRTTK